MAELRETPTPNVWGRTAGVSLSAARTPVGLTGPTAVRTARDDPRAAALHQPLRGVNAAKHRAQPELHAVKTGAARSTLAPRAVRVPPSTGTRLLPANVVAIRCLFLLAVAFVLTLGVIALGAHT